MELLNKQVVIAGKTFEYSVREISEHGTCLLSVRGDVSFEEYDEIVLHVKEMHSRVEFETITRSCSSDG